jgi:hypothetical protein
VVGGGGSGVGGRGVGAGFFASLCGWGGRWGGGGAHEREVELERNAPPINLCSAHIYERAYIIFVRAHILSLPLII